MKGKVLRVVLIVLASIVMIFSLVQIVKHYADEKEAEDVYSDFLDYVKEPDKTEDFSKVETSDLSLKEVEGESTAIPDAEENLLPVIDFDALKANYPHVVGWIYLPDTPINYPIVCGADNNQYLRHLPNGSYNDAGSIFLDYRCGKVGKTRNTVIYGHNMNNGTMFSTLTEYKHQGYFDDNPYIYLLTPEGNYRIEFYAGAVVDISSNIYSALPDDDTFKEVLEEVKNKSTFASDVRVGLSDNIVTLSTCSYEFENARFVMVGKLILI